MASSFERLFEFVERLAKQKITDEFEDHELEGADYQGGYDIIVLESRVVLDAVQVAGKTGNAGQSAWVDAPDNTDLIDWDELAEIRLGQRSIPSLSVPEAGEAKPVALTEAMLEAAAIAWTRQCHGYPYDGSSRSWETFFGALFNAAMSAAPVSTEAGEAEVVADVIANEEAYLIGHINEDCGLMAGDIEGSFHRIREALAAPISTDAGLPSDLADIIEREMMSWRGANGGIYTIHACALGISIAIRSSIARATPDAGAWLPIESAPKDGTRITLYEIGRGAFEGWWHDAWPRACEEYWMDDADSEPEPTHWRPLLAPPVTRHNGDAATGGDPK